MLFGGWLLSLGCGSQVARSDISLLCVFCDVTCSVNRHQIGSSLGLLRGRPSWMVLDVCFARPFAFN